MILPLGDSPNPRGFTPWVTYALIAINVVIFLATWPLTRQRADVRNPAFSEYVTTIATERNVPRVHWQSLAEEMAVTTSAYDLLTFRYGFRPGAPSFAAILASMFLHGGLVHLLGNVLFLWIYGDNVEHRLGRAGYLVAYLLTGVIAAGGDAVLRLGSGIPSIGASGAISGILGFYFTWFPHNRVRLLILLPLWIPFELPARIVLGIYILMNNVFPWLLSGGQATGVSYGAHIGGFVAGWGLGVLLDRIALARREPDLRMRDAPHPERLAEALHDALAQDRPVEASALLFEQPRAETRAGLSAADKIALGDALLSSGHPRGALAAYQRALSDHPRDPLRTHAHLRAAQVLMDALGMPTAAYQHLYSALEEGPSEADATLARNLLTKLGRSSASIPRRMRP